jgi:predicted ABC-type ATPase
MREQSAIMHVFAGNNGSGKSTIRNLIVDRLGISVNIDPHALARSIDAVRPERCKVTAGKEAIKLARDCIRNTRDFSVETTLAGVRIRSNFKRYLQNHGLIRFAEHSRPYTVGFFDWSQNIIVLRLNTKWDRNGAKRR